MDESKALAQALSKALGKPKKAGFEINGVAPAEELYELGSGARVCAGLRLVVQAGAKGKELMVEILPAVKTPEIWEGWVKESGWSFAGSFAVPASVAEEGLKKSGGLLPSAWAWALANPESAGIAQGVLERCLGQAQAEAVCLAASAKKPRRGGSKAGL